MGATNCPETPRQKMIGMMYLVYLALLALNVSAMLLNSFVTVSDTMDASNANIQTKVADTYNKFEQFALTNPDKVGEYYEVAKEVRTYSDDLRTFVDSMKYDFIGQLEKKASVDTGTGEKVTIDLMSGDRVDVQVVERIVRKAGVGWMLQSSADAAAQNHFLGGGEFNPSNEELRAVIIRKKIEEYKAKVTEAVKKAGIDSVDFPGLEVEGEEFTLNVHGKNQKGCWERHTFESNIPIADIILLTRITSDVMNAEFDIANNLYKAVNADDFKFDKVAARVIPKSTYIMQGSQFEADIFVAAYDSKAQLKAEVNGAKLVSTDTNGSITWKTGSGGEGVHKYQGNVYVKAANGEDVAYPFSGEYTVGKPAAVVSLTNMNILYVGVENPVSISVPGIPAKDISATISSGTIASVGGGNYTVKLSKLEREVTINVSAKIDNRVQRMGEFKYKTRKIPSPVLKVGNLSSKKVTKEELSNAGKIRATFPEDFVFKVPPLNVKGYTISVGANDKPISGNTINPEAQSIIKQARKGQRVMITDVEVRLPDGRSETLETAFRIK
ncbi:MAG: hypothetical protein IKQ94_03160 [Bacteroidales bacterium]|nr:hypothetical protein [Bacteroidales bacterium]